MDRLAGVRCTRVMDLDTVDVVRRTALLAAVLSTGLVAGVMLAFAVSVMPALAAADDRTFVAVMRGANAAILTPWFLVPFVAAPLAGLVAAAAHLPASARSGLPWAAAGLALGLVTLVVTGVVNVPLNDALAAAGPTPVDPAAVRAAFEQRWVVWNVVRTVTATLAVGCYAWAALG